MGNEYGGLVDPGSLGATLDAINEALFFAKPVSQQDKTAAAGWIAARQGLPGAYAGMFAPLPQDLRTGVTLFTGERVTSQAGTKHLLGEEACRAMRLLAPLSANAAQALARADAAMNQRLRANEDLNRGRYCCGTCSVAVWRNMQAGGLRPSEQFLATGLAHLNSRRDGRGRWRSYPYYYALLCLSELPQPLVLAELHYAAPGCERLVKRRLRAGNVYAGRRFEVAQQVLSRC
jgi:hypothetical protein